MPTKEIHASLIIKVSYEDGRHKPNPRYVLDLLELQLIGQSLGIYRISEIDFVETGSDSVI